MISRIAACIALLTTSILPLAPAKADVISDQAQKLIEKDAPSIVTIRIVDKVDVKRSGQAQSQDVRLVTEGVVVKADGLIMMSSKPITTELLRESQDTDEKSGLTISPTDFKVIVGNEPKEHTAFLAATDPKLGLAFIKIDDLAGATLPVISFAGTSPVAIGDPVASVTRLGKGYDYAPVYGQAHVAGAITKPRTAWVITGGIISIGLPVFSASNEAIGVMSMLRTGLKAGDSDDGSTMMMTYFGAGSDRAGAFLIPANLVASVIEGAAKQAITVAAERAANPPAPPTTTTPKPSDAPKAAPATAPKPSN